MSQNEPTTDLATSWLVRAYHTPLSDALRGNLSARLDPRAAILGMNLPMSLGDLVLTVTSRTRLWRNEKVDVARELATHFADGLAAGRTSVELTRDFGDVQQAAKLIRAAKRRNRPWPWQVWHYSIRTLMIALATCFALYLALSIRFFWGKPTLAHNFWDEINAARRAPDSDRAWPVYRDTLLKLGKNQAYARRVQGHLGIGPTSKYWQDIVAWVDRHQDALATLREAAARKQLGFYVGDVADLEAAKAHDGSWLIPAHMSLAKENTDIISMLLYGPQETRTIARMFVAEIDVAASRGDGARVTADLTALIGLAEQQRSEPKATLVEQLIGLAIFSVATDSINHLVYDSPTLFSDAQLVALAHRLATFQDGPSTVDMSVEQMTIEDVLQRSYTDDGHGDGRMTLAGFELFDNYAGGELQKLSGLGKSSDPAARLLVAAVCPGVATLVARRADMHDMYYAIMSDIVAAHQGPSWQWDRDKIDSAESRLKGLSYGMNKVRYVIVSILLPAISAVYSASERSLQLRDASETVIAIELWRRRHGNWPQRLEQLVPELLPAVPADRVDGQPLRYLVRDGRPVLYSIGANRRDDGGIPHAEDPYRTIPTQFGPVGPNWKLPEESGDWLLWPVIEVKQEEEDEPEDTPASTTG